MDNSQYKALFLHETYDRLSGIEKGLLALENDPWNRAVVDALFRHYHSIKGMCASMGYNTMKEFTHAQEGLLDMMRTMKDKPTEQMLSLLFESFDMLKEMVHRIEDDRPLDDLDTRQLMEEIGRISSAEKTVPSSKPAPEPPTLHGARVPGIRLSKIMKVESGVFDNLLRITGDLLSVLSGLRAIASESGSIEFKEGVHGLGKSVEELHANILSARMLPFTSVTENLPRIVRDIARQGRKEVRLRVEGGDVTLDRAILECMTDPLVHVIKNAVDHGIEDPDERKKMGKPSCGTITVRAYERRDNAVIEVTDDGRGIDPGRLREKAVAMGMDRARVESMSDREVLMLVCMPALTLSSSVTDVSGRGVGMDAVKDMVEGMGGRLEIRSSPGKGTSIVMELPRTAMIIKVLLVAVDAEVFSIPVSRVEKVVEVERDDISDGEMDYEGRRLYLKELGEVMGMEVSERPWPRKVVVVNGGGGPKTFGILVDDVIDEMDAYIRPLPQPFTRLWGTAGLTVMSDGRPVFLLDTSQLAARVFGRQKTA